MAADSDVLTHRQILARLGLALACLALLALGGIFWGRTGIGHDDHVVHGTVAEAVLLSYKGPAAPPPGVTVPEGMVYVPGGRARIGSARGLPEERPEFDVDVAPFFMDEHPVTVAQFRAFVEATDYVSQAETFGDGAVLDAETYAWELRAGANWRFPQGPSGPAAADDHPVTQVSWNDAVAYATWAGRRLPAEFEWEHAARGATASPHDYAWGSDLHAGGHAHANTWEGQFPFHNSGEDGYLLTSPVGAFGKTPLGLTDMGGNVWEWTDSWFRPYAERDLPFEADAQSERVQRGGSFLCNDDYCHGYRVSARGHSTPESSHFHVGFRTVRDLPR
jgi:sulfatase modifying factor 1